ncbi:hypothetical protein AVEN_193079-1 [Araneus ventricosus]|uniref:Uncharacterized protein n=1 Tax=Araneus ventricosus TaxID=182803 RepID=A0A4Y2B2C1_ARAVE|nr:hypothetical protein AVEN_193079-1 [Araneus ventricosus]
MYIVQILRPRKVLRHETSASYAYTKNRHWYGGRSKNNTLMFMVQCCWLSTPPGTDPNPEHSFISPDRVLARIEKKIRETESVAEQSEHEESLSR